MQKLPGLPCFFEDGMDYLGEDGTWGWGGGGGSLGVVHGLLQEMAPDSLTDGLDYAVRFMRKQTLYRLRPPVTET